MELENGGRRRTPALLALSFKLRSPYILPVFESECLTPEGTEAHIGDRVGKFRRAPIKCGIQKVRGLERDFLVVQ